MRKHFVLGAILALLPATQALADPAGAGSGQPGAWSQSGASVSKPMRPALKASKQNINHTQVTSTNASTTASTSSSISPAKTIEVKVKGDVRVRETK